MKCGVAAILTALLFAPQVALAASCDLNDKTISVHYVQCPRGDAQQRPGLAGQCWETRQMWEVLGTKIAEYADAITPRGTIFTLNQSIEVTNDPEQTQFLFGRNFPQIYRRGWVTASYSAKELRMQTEVKSYLRNDGFTMGDQVTSIVIGVSDDCSVCNLKSWVWSLELMDEKTGRHDLQTRLLDNSISCEIRPSQ
jgi:hypothetical protein